MQFRRMRTSLFPGTKRGRDSKSVTTPHTGAGGYGMIADASLVFCDPLPGCVLVALVTTTSPRCIACHCASV